MRRSTDVFTVAMFNDIVRKLEEQQRAHPISHWLMWVDEDGELRSAVVCVSEETGGAGGDCQSSSPGLDNRWTNGNTSMISTTRTPLVGECSDIPAWYDERRSCNINGLARCHAIV